MFNLKPRLCLAALVLALSVPALTHANTLQAAASAPNDAKVLQNVEKMLADHPSFKSVRPSVEDGIVTIQGSVESYYNKVRLHDKVRGVRGVEGVRNQVEVSTERLSDDQLLNGLAKKLRYDRSLQGSVFNNLTLEVRDGHVNVGGNVRTEVDRDSALAIVANAKGVTDMTNSVNVAPVSIFDDDLRFRLFRAIYRNPTLSRYALDPQAPIRIVVENGHATLYGVVDSKLDKTVADLQARSVPGLFSVDDKLVVASSEAAMAR